MTNPSFEELREIARRPLEEKIRRGLKAFRAIPTTDEGLLAVFEAGRCAAQKREPCQVCLGLAPAQQAHTCEPPPVVARSLEPCAISDAPEGVLWAGWFPRWGEQCEGENVTSGQVQTGAFEGYDDPRDCERARLKHWVRSEGTWVWSIVRGKTLRPIIPLSGPTNFIGPVKRYSNDGIFVGSPESRRFVEATRRQGKWEFFLPPPLSPEEATWCAYALLAAVREAEDGELR